MLFLPEKAVLIAPRMLTQPFLEQVDSLKRVWVRFIKGQPFATEGEDPRRVQVSR